MEQMAAVRMLDFMTAILGSCVSLHEKGILLDMLPWDDPQERVPL